MAQFEATAILHSVVSDKYRGMGGRFLGKIRKQIYIFQNFVVDIIHHFEPHTILSCDFVPNLHEQIFLCQK